MDFNVETFIQTPDWEEFDKLKKADLLKISDHYEGEGGAKPAMRKQEVKNIVIQVLVDNEVFDDAILEHIVEIQGGSESFELKKLEMQMQMQMGKRKEATGNANETTRY